MRRSARLVAAPLVALLLAGCAGGGAGGRVAAAIPGADDVATDDLARTMVDAATEGFDAGPDGEVTTASRLDVQARILTQLVVAEIFQDAADEAGITLTDAEIVEHIETRGDDPTFLRQQLVRRELLQERIIEELGEGGFQLLLDEAIQLDVRIDPRLGSWDPQSGVVPAT